MGLSEFERRILDLIKANPGQKGSAIASKLGVERKQVNSTLHGSLKDHVVQDAEFRWSLARPAHAQQKGPRDGDEATRAPQVPDPVRPNEVPENDDSPECPECGKPMRLRTAQRGANAGGQFWGCSGYPSCRGTQPIEPEPQGKASPDERRQAVVFSARPLIEGHQAAFFQSICLPERLVRPVAGLSRKLVRGLAQWRFDFPQAKSIVEDLDTRNVLAVAEQLLTRGSAAYALPELEALFDVETTSEEELARAVIEATVVADAEDDCRWLDSDAERAFYQALKNHPSYGGRGWRVVPQVSLASLTQKLPSDVDSRGDFLLTNVRADSILVEIDGQQHAQHATRDQGRDAAMQSAGIQTIRIPAASAGDWPTTDGGAELLSRLEAVSAFSTSTPTSTIQWARWLHQLQLALIRALLNGWLEPSRTWCIAVVVPVALRGDEKAETYCRVAVVALRQMLARLSRLHGGAVTFDGALEVVFEADASRRSTPDLVVGPGDALSRNLVDAMRAPQFLVSSLYVPLDIAAPLTPTVSAAFDDPHEVDAEWFLQYLFRKPKFREGQWEVVRRALQGKDSIVLLPTGAGKSIAFQLSSLLLPGRAIIVAPLISLIDDQIENLARHGIDRAAGLTSSMTRGQKDDVQVNLRTGHQLFIYVAPERFQKKEFRDSLRALTSTTPISIVAIDEAHCVSEWGHDFRTAYLNLGRTAREYCETGGSAPPLLALTGTASRIVLKDIQRELQIDEFDAIVTPVSFDRPELRFTVLACRSEEKQDRVLGFLSGVPAQLGSDPSQFFVPNGDRSNCGLVFCPHAKGTLGVTEYQQVLARRLKVPVSVYSGGSPNKVSEAAWKTEKAEAAKDFKSNKVTLMACTKAFGMGIDKPNVRYTVHVALPQSIEAFYQEAGRAGRDRRTAQCALIVSNDDPARALRLLSNATPIDELANSTKDRSNQDDITRALWFHTNAFQGASAEIADVAALLGQCGDLLIGGPAAISYATDYWLKRNDKDPGRAAEKALHRLVVLGIVSDYTVDWSSREFGIRKTAAGADVIISRYRDFVARYNVALAERARLSLLELPTDPFQEFVLSVAAQLVNFVYTHVEQARRQSLSTMLQAATASRTDADIRRRILEYLQQTEWDERLEPLRSQGWATQAALMELLDLVASPTDAAELRGASDRLLASYPDVPGILLVRALAEALCRDGSAEMVASQAAAAVKFALSPYQTDQSDVAATVAWATRFLVNSRKPRGAEALLQGSLSAGGNGRPLLRMLVHLLPVQFAHLPADSLNDVLTERVGTVLDLVGKP